MGVAGPQCQGASSSDVVLRRLSAELGIDEHDDTIGAILDRLVASERTLIAFDKLDAIYAPADLDQQEATDLLLATLAAVDEVTLIITFSGAALPESVIWSVLDDCGDGVPPELQEQHVPKSVSGDQIREPMAINTVSLLANYNFTFGSHSSRFPQTILSVRFLRAFLVNLLLEYGMFSKSLASRPPHFCSTIAQSSVPPAKPSVFYGRDREVERLVKQALIAQSAPLGIVGPGGIGKTTLALKVLHDPRIRSRFAKQRFFVSCEGATGSDDVLGQLALKLDVQRSADTPLWSAVLANLRARQSTFLVIDNFETIWSPTNKSLRDEAEIFLAQLVVLDELTLVVTTRGNTLPEMFDWANADTAELDTLSSTAARQTFTDLSYLEPDVLSSEPEASALTELLREVDFMPLAINLLARLDDLPSRLLREWAEHHAEVLEADRHDGTRRELSVEVSIKISLAHLPAETLEVRPRQLLSVCGELPAGLFPSISEKLRITIANIDQAAQYLLRNSLVYVGGLGELKMLSPVRHYVSHRLSMSDQTRSSVETIYQTLASQAPLTSLITVNNPVFEGEIPNIISILSSMAHRPSDELVEAASRIAFYGCLRNHLCLPLLRKLLEHAGRNPLWKAECLDVIGSQLAATGDKEQAVENLERAAELFGEWSRNAREGSTRRLLGVTLVQLGRREEGEHQLAKSQPLLEASDWASTAHSYVAVSGATKEENAVTEQRCRDSRNARLQAGDLINASMISESISRFRAKDDDHEGATRELEIAHALAVQGAPDSPWLAALKNGLAQRCLKNDDVARAEQLVCEAYTMFTLSNDRRGLATATHVLGHVRLQQCCFEEAYELFCTGSRLQRECGAIEDSEACDREAENAKRLATL